MGRILLVGVACIALSGCATAYSLSPAGNEGAEVHYSQGAPTLISYKEGGVVRAGAVKSIMEGRMVLYTVAFNRARVPTNIGFENVSVALEDGTPLKTYSFQQLRREAKSRAAWAKFGVALATASSAASDAAAGQSQTNGTITGSNGQFASFSGTTYNSGVSAQLASQHRAEQREEMNRIDNNLEAALTRLDGSVLQTTTVYPNASAGGLIVMDRPALRRGVSKKIIISIAFGAEVHKFSFYATADGVTPPAPVQSSTFASGPAISTQNAAFSAPVETAVSPPNPALSSSTAFPAPSQATSPSVGCTPDQEEFARRFRIPCSSVHPN